MAVKRSSSAARMLSVFEQVAAVQPVGVSSLARDLAADKSAVQRDLMTLADAGWIRMSPGLPGRWELTPHIMTLARAPHSSRTLRRRARPILEHLRAQTGETTYLTVPDGEQFVVLDALESHHMLRMVPPLGMVVPMEGSATARAILSYLPEIEQAHRLGRRISGAMREEFTATRSRGYAINDRDIEPNAVAVAAAILDEEGMPAGALVVSGPAERLAGRHDQIGTALRAAAMQLSQVANS